MISTRSCRVTDAIMVARGDLGVEMAPEQVPIVQKDLIAAASRHNVTVITATQMLKSMITNPRPTRAEASDVANAIFDGTDAMMLSGETAVGQFPVEAVAMMARIATATEGCRRFHEQFALADRLAIVRHGGQYLARDLTCRAHDRCIGECGRRSSPLPSRAIRHGWCPRIGRRCRSSP